MYFLFFLIFKVLSVNGIERTVVVQTLLNYLAPNSKFFGLKHNQVNNSLLDPLKLLMKNSIETYSLKKFKQSKIFYFVLNKNNELEIREKTNEATVEIELVIAKNQQYKLCFLISDIKKNLENLINNNEKLYEKLDLDKENYEKILKTYNQKLIEQRKACYNLIFLIFLLHFFVSKNLKKRRRKRHCENFLKLFQDVFVDFLILTESLKKIKQQLNLEKESHEAIVEKMVELAKETIILSLKLSKID